MPSTTIKYFDFAHLPHKLQLVSKPLGELAQKLEHLLPDGPEKSAGMRKLLEAKDCFVRAALDMPDVTGTTLQPHQQRVLEEKQELDLRIAKLDEFVRRSPAFGTAPADEQARLLRQLDVMRELSTILRERIDHF